MATRYASELNAPLVDENGVYIDRWDDELGVLNEWLRIDPSKEGTIGQPYIDPETGEEAIKNHWFGDDYQFVYQYHIYTNKEKQDIAAQETINERQQLINSSPERIDTVEDVQASTDEAICDLYEQLVTAQDTIQSQDDAVCELYELILGTEEE